MIDMSVLNRKNNYFNKVRKSLIKLANIIDPESEVIEEGSFYDDVSESLERIADNYEGGGGKLPDVTSADNGKTVMVEDGEWMVDSNKFLITLTATSETTFTADKTGTEITEAYLLGKEIWLYNSVIGTAPVLYIQQASNDRVVFMQAYIFGNDGLHSLIYDPLDPSADWYTAVIPIGLPSVSSSDNGKVAKVVDGEWVAGLENLVKIDGNPSNDELASILNQGKLPYRVAGQFIYIFSYIIGSGGNEAYYFSCIQVTVASGVMTGSMLRMLRYEPSTSTWNTFDAILPFTFSGATGRDGRIVCLDSSGQDFAYYDVLTVVNKAKIDISEGADNNLLILSYLATQAKANSGAAKLEIPSALQDAWTSLVTNIGRVSVGGVFNMVGTNTTLGLKVIAKAYTGEITCMLPFKWDGSSYDEVFVVFEPAAITCIVREHTPVSIPFPFPS